MSWLDYNNGLFTRSDFNNIRFGRSGNDQLSGRYISTCPPGALCIVGGYFTTDYLEGNRGTDTLNGGGGNDVLVGVDPDNYNPGAGEYDRLNGGFGNDTFVLGDNYEAYYEGNGYAIIEDFNQGQDMLAAHGSASDYTFDRTRNIIGNSSNDTILFYKGDAIAIFEDDSISLNANDFYFL